MVWAFHIIWISLVVVLVGTGGSNALHEHVLHNAQGVNFQNLHRRAAGITSHPDQGAEVPAHASTLQAPLVVAVAASEFSVQTFTQPLDHFDNTTDATFQQRFWVNTRHYKPRHGSPVIVIDGGETNGEDRLPFWTQSIDIMSRQVCGCPNFSTDSLRWLNNEQALEDSANFMRNVKFENIDENLTARKTPWIYYGGSYAGARAAHMRVLYPDLVFGAIASSAVTHAVLMNWDISMIDSLLKIGPLRGRLKSLFGLSELESDKDFARCSRTGILLLVDDIRSVLCDAERRHADPERHGAYGAPGGGLKANIALLNYAKWIRETAPPVGTPTIISRLLDIDYEHKICMQAFPPGEYYKVPPLPNVTAVNVLGDYHIALIG
ncbi:serine carboxypeptidase S28-domain-containing protein [Lactifluus volemus]|nr:serine carboxypeptidase S28-domain-containing protein [Lactifluus volemus]